MSNVVAAVAPSEREWAALAAIDWADKKNFWRLLPAGSRQSEDGEFGLGRWAGLCVTS